MRQTGVAPGGLRRFLGPSLPVVGTGQPLVVARSGYRHARLVALALVAAAAAVTAAVASDGGTRGSVYAEGQDVRFVMAETADESSGPSVGTCTATVGSDGNATISVDNGYPGYACRLSLWVRNDGSDPVTPSTPQITCPPAVVLTPMRADWSELAPGEVLSLEFRLEISAQAQPGGTYGFSIVQTFAAAE